MIQPTSLQLLSPGFRKLPCHERRQDERQRAEQEGPAQSFSIGHHADGVRRQAAQGAGAIVGKAEGAGANARGKELAADDPRTGEETCSKETEQRSKDKDG